MRRSERARASATASIASLFLFGALLAACGTAAVTPSPPPSPTPTPTPDPHLSEPASVGAVFAGLNAAGLKITANNADTGGANGEPRKRLNTTYAGWPLILSEFSSAKALASWSGFKADETPGIGDAPFNLVGLNILVEFGPHAKNAQTVPDPKFVQAAQALVDALDPLLSPLSQSSVQPLEVPLPSAAPSASGSTGPSPSAAHPSAPAASPSS